MTSTLLGHAQRLGDVENSGEIMKKGVNDKRLLAGSTNTKPTITGSVSRSLTAEEQERVSDYLKAATSDNTRRTYRSAIRQFQRWGGRLPAEPDAVIRYLLERQPQVSVRTLGLHITALRQWHEHQQLADPTRNPLVQKTLEGMRRRHGEPKRKARPLSMEDMEALITWMKSQTDSLTLMRDRALILTAFFGAFRRSELVALRYEDIAWYDDGIVVTLLRSKTDQLGEGMERALPRSNSLLCPVTALQNWRQCTGGDTGPVFRRINRWGQLGERPLDASSVNLILKKWVADAGLGHVSGFSSHSFRRGLSTSAARAGVDFELIRKQGGWKQDATVREYIEEGRALDHNAARDLLNKSGGGNT